MKENMFKHILAKEENLTREEEKSVFCYYREHRTIENRNLIVQKNLGLVNFVINELKYVADYNDYFQEGVIGLMKAVDKYDETKDFKFSSYAWWWIQQTIVRSAYEENQIHVPPMVRKEIRDYLKCVSDYESSYGRTPSALEVAEMMDCPVSKAEYINQLRTVMDISLYGDDDSINEIPDERDVEEIIMKKNEKEKVVQLLNNLLSEKQRYVIFERYGLNDGECHTLKEVGDKLGITRERVRQIEASAMRLLKKESYCLR